MHRGSPDALSHERVHVGYQVADLPTSPLTRKLAEAGHEVVLINRDIKPGGLVEYGIYWNKHKMKEGIRAQFRKILADPRVHYLGNVKIAAVPRYGMRLFSLST